MGKTYIITQIVEATPMTLGEYNKSIGRRTLKTQNPEDRGYLIKNTTTNAETWVGHYQFTASAEEMDDIEGLYPYQARLIGERAYLHGLLFKLENAIRHPSFLNHEFKERELLSGQARAMNQYLSKLDKRINLFKPATESED